MTIVSLTLNRYVVSDHFHHTGIDVTLIKLVIPAPQSQLRIRGRLPSFSHIQLHSTPVGAGPFACLFLVPSNTIISFLLTTLHWGSRNIRTLMNVLGIPGTDTLVTHNPCDYYVGYHGYTRVMMTCDCIMTRNQFGGWPLLWSVIQFERAPLEVSLSQISI
jgi:hypothetical protein